VFQQCIIGDRNTLWTPPELRHIFGLGPLLQNRNTSTKWERPSGTGTPLFEISEKCSNNTTLGKETPSGPLWNGNTSPEWEHPLQNGNTYLEWELFSKTGTHFYSTGTLLWNGNTPLEWERLFETLGMLLQGSPSREVFLFNRGVPIPEKCSCSRGGFPFQRCPEGVFMPNVALLYATNVE